MHRSNICPRCGRPEHPDRRRVPHARYTAERFYSGDGVSMPRASIEEFHTPARDASLASDVLVPVIQALITAMVSMMIVTPIVFAADLDWRFIFVAGGLALAATWLYLLSEHRRSLWTHERYENEPARPSAPSEPTQHKKPAIRLEIREDKNRVRFAHLPVDLERLSAMARAINNGRGFSTSQWSGSGKLLSRSEFESLRDWLIDSDYAAWRDDANHSLGTEWTSKGRSFWRGIADG